MTKQSAKKETEAKSEVTGEKLVEMTNDKETKAIIKYLVDKMDKMEAFCGTLGTRIDSINAAMDDVKAQVNGSDPGFERALKDGSSAPRVLNKSQEEIYGTLAGQELQDITHKVLGSDCHAYVKADKVLPRTMFTVLVSERLSGQKDNFRTRQINNASATSDAKQWLEKIKSNLFRQYSREDKGAPEFRTR